MDTLSSLRASLIPIQFLGPDPKGIQAYGLRWAFSSGVNLEEKV